MGSSVLVRYALGIGAIAVFLAGCGSVQPLQTTVGAPPEARRATAGDLLYVTGNTGTWAYVYMLTYPAGDLVGKISKQITGLCSDSAGDVYMTQSFDQKSTIFEYGHGAKKPKATLSDPYNGAYGCAVDPKTGNLAVANSDGGTVLVYAHARGKPKRYLTWFAPYYVAYGPNGELFVLGRSHHTGFAVLANGEFHRISLDKHIEYPMGAQWDGKYMALGNGAGTYTDGLVREYTIAGRKGSQTGVTPLNVPAENFFIDGSTIAVSDGYALYFFPYPGGGQSTKTITGLSRPESLTVSVAP